MGDFLIDRLSALLISLINIKTGQLVLRLPFSEAVERR
jgi:hypothetical protein